MLARPQTTAVRKPGKYTLLPVGNFLNKVLGIFAHLSIQVAIRVMPTRVAARRNLSSRVAKGSASRKASST